MSECKRCFVYTQSYTAYEKELTQLQKKIADTAAVINDNKLKFMEASFNERLAELQRKSDDAEADHKLRLQDAYSKLALFETKASDWETEARNFREELIEAERARDHFKNESDRWRSGAENREREKTEIERKRDEIEALASSLKIEIDELKQTHEDLEKQNAQLGDFIGSITTERDQLRVCYDVEVAERARGVERRDKVRTENTRSNSKFNFFRVFLTGLYKRKAENWLVGRLLQG
jgi:chromosome segregation ATPase